MKKQINTFLNFYKLFYLPAHSNIKNQIIHFIGTSSFILGMALALYFKIWVLIPLSIFIGYLLPHLGHTKFQKNNSLRNSHPLYCIIGASLLYFQNWLKIIKYGKL